MTQKRRQEKQGCRDTEGHKKGDFREAKGEKWPWRVLASWDMGGNMVQWDKDRNRDYSVTPKSPGR